MLSKTYYVATIIPASYVQTGLFFFNRLFGVVLLECKMFSDTDCPVCLALFVPEKQKTELLGKYKDKKNSIKNTEDFFVYVNKSLKGTREYLQTFMPIPEKY